MKIILCNEFTAIFLRTQEFNIHTDLGYEKSQIKRQFLEIDLDLAKTHIENCEICSKNISDLIDNFSGIISPLKMMKLIKTIKG